MRLPPKSWICKLSSQRFFMLMLMLVMNPPGNIPMFISALKDVPTEPKRVVLTRE